MRSRNSQVINLHSGNIKLNSLFDVGQSLPLALPLAYASGKTEHLCHVAAVLSGIDHNLPHIFVIDILEVNIYLFSASIILRATAISSTATSSVQ